MDDGLRCPRCGLTEAELRTHGRMGCVHCYTVFETTVLEAARELHGVDAHASIPPPLPPRPPLPWPERQPPREHP